MILDSSRETTESGFAEECTFIVGLRSLLLFTLVFCLGALENFENELCIHRANLEGD